MPSSHFDMDKGGVVRARQDTAFWLRQAAPGICVRAVPMKAGWVGQVLVGDAIVWESTPVHDPVEEGVRPQPRGRDNALDLARQRVTAAFTRLVGEVPD